MVPRSNHPGIARYWGVSSRAIDYRSWEWYTINTRQKIYISSLIHCNNPP
nr:MAG TPA: hypothetical protein [Bacteriophage sp.]